MSTSLRAGSAPRLSRSERPPDIAAAEASLPAADSRDARPADAAVSGRLVPDELLLSLTSTVCCRKTRGVTAQQHHCKACGIRRPDAVWHHSLGRDKYRYFLEQPTSLTGAGRDISFLCDAMVTQRKTTPLPPLTSRRGICEVQSSSVSESLIPEEYHVVKNKGLQSLEFYEDAFTVKLQDAEQKPRAFPSLRPSGRLEVVRLMRIMDDMLEKAGVDQQGEELTELSQMESLLKMVQTEQNIYNIVFHELIRQVSVGCAERGQLLAKLRQRYQALLDRIPHRLKALHTEAVAQRALDRQLVQEIHRISASIQRLGTELSRIKDHDAFVSHQAERAHQQLAEALSHTHTNADVVQGYHELYELQRGRLEAQLLQMSQERDRWSRLALCLAQKLTSVKKLQLVSRLHISGQSCLTTAEHCSSYIASEDTKDLNAITELTDRWAERLTAFICHQKKSERAQCAQITAVLQGVAKWLAFCAAQSKCTDPKYESASLEEIHADLEQWSDMLVLQCERYQGEELLRCQQTLAELDRVQERWLDRSLKLFRRHLDPDGELPKGQQVLRELDRIISENLKQLDTHVTGESGIHRQITSLRGLLESWVTKLGAATSCPERMPVSDWLKLEETLHVWQSLTEGVLQKVSAAQTENQGSENTAGLYTETEKILDRVQEFVSSLSNFSDSENQRLVEEISSIHMAQTCWMLELLLLMVPDYSENLSKEQQNKYIISVPLHKLEEDAKVLAEQLDCYTRYITSSCQRIVEEHILQNPHEVEDENIMNECRKLQTECTDWVETSIILLSGVKGGAVEVPDRHADPASSGDVALPPADTLVNEEFPAEPAEDDEVKEETDAKPEKLAGGCGEEQMEISQGEIMVCDNHMVKMIGYDGNIMHRKLGEHRASLKGTEELLVSPATDETRKAFSDLTTVGLLQQQLYDSEMRAHSAEQRALKAEEALQAALERIRDLDRQLKG